MTPARWLVDTSVLARIEVPAVADVLLPAIDAGLVAVSVVTELEVGFSARSKADYRRSRQLLLDRLMSVHLPARAEARAREVQAALVERGQHRSPGVADLLLAATAEIERLAVWHYDADFDVIAAVTGQETAWIVPPGSVA